MSEVHGGNGREWTALNEASEHAQVTAKKKSCSGIEDSFHLNPAGIDRSQE